jgi:hypothetical protein
MKTTKDLTQGRQPAASLRARQTARSLDLIEFRGIDAILGRSSGPDVGSFSQQVISLESAVSVFEAGNRPSLPCVQELAIAGLVQYEVEASQLNH